MSRRDRIGLGAVKGAIACALLVGCGSGATPPAGTERGPCLPNGTCQDRLSCFSRFCVRYDAGGPGAGGLIDTGSSGGGAPGAGGATPGAGGAIGGTSGAGGAGGTALPDAGGGASDARDVAPEVSDGGGRSCDGAFNGPSETVVAGSCGFTPATTSASYSGIVSVTVSGLLVNAPGTPLLDAFYLVEQSDTSIAIEAFPDGLRYNRLAETACVCSTECASISHRIADLLVDGYPAFRADHTYTVLLDLGAAAADRLDFGMFDCGCSDNSGSFTITIAAAACDR